MTCTHDLTYNVLSGKIVKNEQGTFYFKSAGENFINGRCVTENLHRTDGPAGEYTNGTRAWFHYGQLHRTDGPAVEYANGYRTWYLNNQLLTEAEFNQLTL